MNKSKILILGSSGFIGKYLINKFKKSEIIYTYCTNKNSGGIKFNALTMDLKDIFCKYENISDVIILLNMKDPRWCYYNPNESHNINVKSIKNILIQLKLYNIKPVFISTDAVYDGYGSNYSEDDKPNPIMLYGKQKIIIEEYIKNNFDDYIIFRLAKTYSIDLDDKNILFPKWLTNYSNNNQIICAQDCVISPICVNDVADVIYQSIHKNINGVYNLGGDISYSLYELNKIFYSIFVKFYNNKIKITPIKFNEYDNCDELWPLNCSMENEKLNNVLNLNFKSVEKRINTMLNQYLLTGGNL